MFTADELLERVKPSLEPDETVICLLYGGYASGPGFSVPETSLGIFFVTDHERVVFVNQLGTGSQRSEVMEWFACADIVSLRHLRREQQAVTFDATPRYTSLHFRTAPSPGIGHRFDMFSVRLRLRDRDVDAGGGDAVAEFVEVVKQQRGAAPDAVWEQLYDLYDAGVIEINDLAAPKAKLTGWALGAIGGLVDDDECTSGWPAILTDLARLGQRRDAGTLHVDEFNIRKHQLLAELQ